MVGLGRRADGAAAVTYRPDAAPDTERARILDGAPIPRNTTEAWRDVAASRPGDFVVHVVPARYALAWAGDLIQEGWDEAEVEGDVIRASTPRGRQP